MRACPNCGCSKSKPTSYDGDYWRSCSRCGMCSPACSSAARAKKWWNTEWLKPEEESEVSSEQDPAGSMEPRPERSAEYERGIAWAEAALHLMAGDNSMIRTSTPVNIDETLAKQATRVGTHSKFSMEDFVTGHCCKATRLAVMCGAVDFHDWLNRCFEGFTKEQYFTQLEEES